MAFGMGQMEGDMTKGSPEVMVLGEESASVPLTPSIVGGSVLAGTSQQEGSVVIRATREPSLALMSVGNDSPMWGEPLLWWVSLEDPMLMLFTLNAAVKSMEWESLDLGVASMLKALDHA